MHQFLTQYDLGNFVAPENVPLLRNPACILDHHEDSNIMSNLSVSSGAGHVAIPMENLHHVGQAGAQQVNHQSPDHVSITMPDDITQAGPANSSSTAARWAKNVGAVCGRNACSVLLPTAAREAMRRGPFTMLQAAAPTLTTGLGTASALAPIAMQVAGMVKDARDGTQTMTSLASRVGLIMLNGGTVVAAAATGTLPVAAPALMAANLVYTPLRDIVQYNLRLQDKNAPDSLHPAATIGSASAYFLNQFAVGEAMDAVSDALVPTMGKIAANTVGRAAVNFVGETVDEFTLNGLAHMASPNSQPLEFGLSLRSKEDRTWDNVANTTLTTHAARSDLFSSGYSAAYAADKGGVGAIGQNAIVGAVLGAGYAGFVASHLKQPKPSAGNIEAGPVNNPPQSAAATAVVIENEVNRSPRSSRSSRPTTPDSTRLASNYATPEQSPASVQREATRNPGSLSNHQESGV